MPGPVLTPATVGASQQASRWALQVDTASSDQSPSWVTVFGVFNFQPTVNYTMQDNSDYDSEQWGSDFPTQRKWSNTVSLRDKRYGGTQDPGQAFIQVKSDALDLIHTRWFDREGGPEAYEGWAYAQWQPQGGAVTDESTTQVIFNGQGKRKTISNPVGVGVKPTITNIVPSSASEDEIVTIIGSNFTGTTTVTFDANPVGDFYVQSDSVLIATLPAGTGAEPVVVTNGTGASDPYSYVRGD